MRRAIMSLLLLLLVGLQAYAGVCSVRCGDMDLGATRDSVPGMANCRGISMNPEAQVTKALFSPVKSCSKLCQNDWNLLQIRANRNLDAQVYAVCTLPALDSRAPLLGFGRLERFSIDRSPPSTPPFDLLISNLRI